MQVEGNWTRQIIYYLLPVKPSILLDTSPSKHSYKPESQVKGIKMKLVSSYIEGGRWFKGNLHTHTTLSDGSCPPEEVIADYDSRGYDFLSISDHDRFVKPEDYQSSTKMTLIPGVEVTANGPHILHVGTKERIEPDSDRQPVIEKINAQGAMAILNHPNWLEDFNHFPQELMEALEGYVGIEIYNGVIERERGASLAIDKWDMLLSHGRRVWGFANDDSHKPDDVEKAWIVVKTNDNSLEGILEAIRSGSFYSSTGVEIRDFRVDGDTIFVSTANCQRICFITRHRWIRSTVDAPQASFSISEFKNIESDEVVYVRAECYGSGGAIAWTQPIFIE